MQPLGAKESETMHLVVCPGFFYKTMCRSTRLLRRLSCEATTPEGGQQGPDTMPTGPGPTGVRSKDTDINQSTGYWRLGAVALNFPPRGELSKS